MLSPLDTTTDPMAVVQRRLAALEERAAAFQAGGRPVSYLDSPSPAATTAKLNALESAGSGTIMALKEENEVGGTKVLLVKFPSPEYGWFTV